jgi:putative transposase
MSEFYHTYNRGVEKRKIFLENSDYFRGVHDLYEFNDVNAALNLGRDLCRKSKGSEGMEGSRTSFHSFHTNRPRERLVDLFVWSFMPNHYHLFSNSVKDNGLPEFHRKFGCGFTNFFNIKYKRSGVLFQGGYKKVHVTGDAQSLQLICYIHSNPLDLWKPTWKERGLTNLEIQNALRFLEKYRWSSHLDWWGIKNFPSLIDMNSMTRFFKNSEEYREFFTNWLKYYEKNIENLSRSLILE